MKTLITIAGTLLAGATPFAANAALNSESARTSEAKQVVRLRRATAPAPAQQSQEALELEELRRTVAELRAEKHRLSAELLAERATAESSAANVHEWALQGWTQEYLDALAESGDPRWLAVVNESVDESVESAARAEYETLRAQQAETEAGALRQQLLKAQYEAQLVELQSKLAQLQAEEAGILLDVEALEQEEGVLLEVRARLAEAQAELDEEQLELDLLRPDRAVDPQQGGDRWRVVTESVEPNADSDSRGVDGRRVHMVVVQDGAGDSEVVREQLEGLALDSLRVELEDELQGELEQAAIDALLHSLEAQELDRSAPEKGLHVRRFVIDGEAFELDGDEATESHPLIVDGDGVHGRFIIAPDCDPDAAPPEAGLWVELDGEEHLIHLDPKKAHSRTFIHDPQVGVKTRVHTGRKLLVYGDDGELLEIDVPEAPEPPAAATSPSAPRAPTAIGGGRIGSTQRDTIRWHQSGVAPRSGGSHANDRDELLREVHVLTKEMLAELRLLRAAVDELRRDIDTHHASGRAR